MGGSCATGHYEPCQAGNRAALSSFPVCRSKSAHSYARVRKFFSEVKSMAYQALYRKYRPQTFADVVGQEHITETLKNELSSGKTVHAYLFTGTRGTGKTSCAKILARALNCLDLNEGDPCLKCDACLLCENGENTDIVEIDAASNNSVDNIRELRDLVSFTPANSKYRVFIIDEVHMLSPSAFNALLKTLEEPPSHVVFILATTEVHKLPATILSRCQRFDFRRIEAAKICERIQYIANNEGLTVTDNAAFLIAAAADGGMRDALSILDLCASNSKNIDEKVVESVCAMAGNDYLLELCDSIKEKDAEKALLLLDKLHNSSVDMLRLLSELTGHFRDLMIVKTVKSPTLPIVCSVARMNSLKKQAEDFSINEIMCCLSVLQSASAGMQTGNRRTEMEMLVLKLCNPSLSTDTDSLERRIALLEKAIENLGKQSPAISDNASFENEISTSKKENPAAPETDILTQEALEPKTAEVKTTTTDITPLDSWDEILELLKTECPLIRGVLNDSKAYIKGQYLLIDAPNSQFRSMINNGSYYKDSIRKAAYKILGVSYKLGPYTKATASTETDDPLKAFAQKLKNFEI